MKEEQDPPIHKIPQQLIYSSLFQEKIQDRRRLAV
jgi:hypothetical protein